MGNLKKRHLTIGGGLLIAGLVAGESAKLISIEKKIDDAIRGGN